MTSNTTDYTPPTTPISESKTKVIVIVDNSGSMHNTDTTSAVSAIATEAPVDSKLTVYSFNSEYTKVYEGDSDSYNNHKFDPDGPTNLYGTICK